MKRKLYGLLGFWMLGFGFSGLGYAIDGFLGWIGGLFIAIGLLLILKENKT